MALFSRKEAPFDRARIMSAASTARAKGNRKKAIAEYRRVLAALPDDCEVHAKIAPLLVENKELDAAWASFRLAGEGYHAKGFADKAISIFKQAGSQLPWRVHAFERIAELHLERERRGDAIKILVEARALYRGRADRESALRVLERLLAIDPDRLDAQLDVAWLLKKTGRKAEAHTLLEDLVHKRAGPERRRVRKALFALHPTPASLLRWWLNR